MCSTGPHVRSAVTLLIHRNFLIVFNRDLHIEMLRFAAALVMCHRIQTGQYQFQIWPSSSHSLQISTNNSKNSVPQSKMYKIIGFSGHLKAQSLQTYWSQANHSVINQQKDSYVVDSLQACFTHGNQIEAKKRPLHKNSCTWRTTCDFEQTNTQKMDFLIDNPFMWADLFWNGAHKPHGNLLSL